MVEIIEEKRGNILRTLSDPDRMKKDIGEHVAKANEVLTYGGWFERFESILAKKAVVESRPPISANLILEFKRNAKKLKNEDHALAYALNDLRSLGNENVECYNCDLKRLKMEGSNYCRDVLSTDVLTKEFEVENFDYIKRYVEKNKDSKRIGNLEHLKTIAESCETIKEKLLFPKEIFDYLNGKFFIRNAKNYRLANLGRFVEENVDVSKMKNPKVVIMYEPIGKEGSCSYGCTQANMNMFGVKKSLTRTALVTSPCSLPAQFNEAVYHLSVYNEVGA